MFKLESKSGHSFDFTLEEAKHSRVVQSLLLDDENAKSVSVPYGSAKTFGLIRRFIQVGRLDEMNDETYFETILVSNYLDFDQLTRRLVKHLGMRVIRARRIPDHVFDDLKDLLMIARCFFTNKIELAAFYLRIGWDTETIEKDRLYFSFGFMHLSFPPSVRLAIECKSIYAFKLFYLLVPKSVLYSDVISVIVSSGFTEALSLLLKDRDEVNQYLLKPPFKDAIRSGNAQVLQMLLEDELLPTRFHFFPDLLREAIRYLASDMLMIILLYNPQLKLATNPFLLPAENGQVDMIEILLKYPQFDYVHWKNDALRAAARFKKYDIIRLFLQDPSVNRELLMNHFDPEIQKIY